jgi:two-component system, sensor histidine kinase LadS
MFFKAVIRVLLAALLALAAACAAQTIAAPPWNGRAVPGQYWVDASGRATLEAARAAFEAGQGKPVDPDQVMPLGGGKALWYRLDLPAVSRPTSAILTVTFGGTDSVELFRPDRAGGWRLQRAGDSVPVNQWPLPYLRPAFAFTLQPGDAQATFARVLHTHPIRVEWVLQDARAFTTTARAWHLGMGIYVGFMLLVLLLSFINTVSWRDSIHIYYAVHVVLVGLSVLSLTGLAGEYLWPGNAWWNDKAPVVLPAASMAWAGLFVRELVAERGARLVSGSLLLISALFLGLTVAVTLLSREVFYRVPSLFLVPGMLLILGILAWYARRRPQVGLWVLAGVTVLVAGSLWPLVRNLGLIEPSFLTENGPQLGAALEIPLVLVGLYFRGRERRDSRVRLEALPRSDPLTGLGNQRMLLERLNRLLKRARRDPLLGAVMRVRVANLDAIRTEHGREAMEAALVRAAECVTHDMAEGDTVGREEGGDLVMVMEGQVTRTHASEAGRDIIARGLKFSRLLPPTVTLHLRIAAVCAPLPDVDGAVVLALLDHELQALAADPHGKAMRILANAEDMEHFEDGSGAIPHRG